MARSHPASPGQEEREGQFTSTNLNDRRGMEHTMTEPDTQNISDESASTASGSSTSKKSTTKKKTTKKTTAKKAAAKKSTAKKAAAKKTTTKKAAAKKTATKKTTTKKAATKKTTTKKAATKKATTKKAAAKKTTTKKTTTKKAAASTEVESDVESATTEVTAEAVDGGSDSAEPTTNDAEDDSNGEAEPETGERRKRRRRRGGRGKSRADGEETTTSETESEGEESSDDPEKPEVSDQQAKKKSRSRREWKRPDRAAIEVTPSGPKAPDGSRLMLVDEVPDESCRIAILENGRIEELFVERAQSSTAVGNIYKARVVNVERAIQAAFVDYGQGMNGFLHVSDLHPRYFPGGDKTEKVGRKTPRRDRPPIEDALKKGQEILVQVLKQGVGTKGPTVTSYLSIPGRLMVMMPGMDRVGVSRKVDDEQRDRMRKILDELDLPEGFGFILRTAGYDKTKSELKRDVSYLRRLWEQLEKRMDKVGAPSELYTEGDLIVRTIRDVVDDSIGSIVINSDSGFERASTFLNVIAPKSGPTVRHYDDPVPLFDAFDAESQIDMIHAREVPLKSGGALVIDQTEAMVAIDVNSGRSRGARDAEANAVSTNREAVDEIARQLRLRDQGGLVVCDLIDMRFARNRKELEERLAENLGRDRARTTFLPISEFGLVEMTRQRIRPSIRSQYFSPCTACGGLGEARNGDSVAADAIRRAARLLSVDQVARVEIACGTRVASALLAGHRRRIDALERSSGGKVDIRISEQMPSDRFDAYAYDDRGADLDISRLARLKKPDVEKLPTEITESSIRVQEEDEDTGDGRRRRRRRRRKPAPADVVAIALAGGFDDDFDDDEDDDDKTVGTETSTDSTQEEQESEGGGRRRRRRRRRRRGRGGESAEEIPVPTEPIRVHALAKELEITSRELLDAVTEKLEGLELKGHQSSIPADRILEVKALFAPPAPEPTDSEKRENETDTNEAGDSSGSEDSSGDEDESTTNDQDAADGDAPRKKRRRRRRGGRRRRGRGGDGDGDGDESGSENRGEDSTDERGDRPKPEPVTDTPKPEPAPRAAAPIGKPSTKEEVPTIETPKPKPKRRSLYGGRNKRVGASSPASTDQR
ncbi:MAG: Rne/Rng family ribonuclease [Phycisphaera sp.]|nr:Rne/Rng family ribonuclease [Phycisphaera sp.]